MHTSLSTRFAALALLLPLFVPFTAQAGECWSEPYYETSGTATVKSGVFMRSGPCQDGTTVLATAPAATTVNVLAEDHGWHLIRLQSGATGWVWESFLTVGSLQRTDSDRATVEAKFPVTAATTTPAPAPTPTVTPTPAPVISGSLTTRMKGRILLQVQDHGEAWYVDPVSAARYYLKDGPTAYEALRKFGLGVTEADYASLQSPSSAITKRLVGRIVLRVQAHGEAYYIHPDTRELHYLKDGPAAYSVMRFLSLGITNADLATIPAKEIIVPVSATPTPSTPVVTPVGATTSDLAVSSAQYLPVPSTIDLLELNRYWVDTVNVLRAEKGLRLLVLDQRWLDSTAEWSAIAAVRGSMSHTRDDGKSMHQWIDAKGLPFTVRYSTDGWRVNYFTENISWGYAANSMADAKEALDETLAMYLNEGPTGVHYKTVYHADWNSVGAGFAFVPTGDAYTLYQTFHYGSLQNAGE